MAFVLDAFGYDAEPLHGPQIIAQRTELSAGCLSEGEIDANIKRLKDELDEVGRRMKDWLRFRPRDSFDGDDDA